MDVQIKSNMQEDVHFDISHSSEHRLLLIANSLKFNDRKRTNDENWRLVLQKLALSKLGIIFSSCH